MPYIPPQNRPAIDQCAEALAGRIANRLEKETITAAVSEIYRESFMKIARAIVALETGKAQTRPADEEQALAASVVTAAKAYNQPGGFLGELNYALTRLIQLVPFVMYKRGAWKEALRYWLYAETVGALVRTSYEIHATMGDDWRANGIAGVFERCQR
jgi:hypothetical protein